MPCKNISPNSKVQSPKLFTIDDLRFTICAIVSKNIVYFDLETQKSADEVGGWGNISKMGMSIGVTCSSASGEYKIYGEKQVDELIKDLQRADLVVGFNNLRFDYEVLHGYTSFDLSQLPTLDMMVELQNNAEPPAFARLDRDGDVRRGKNGGRFAGDPVVQGRQACRNRGVLLLRRENHQARPRIRPAAPAASLQQPLREKNDRAGELVKLNP